MGMEWGVWEMSEYVTGQIYGWNGGECPVHPKTKIKIWTRNGNVFAEGGCGAEHFLWRHHNSIGDIVCFQVITPHTEPKTIWVNEYGDGRGFGYTSEEIAKSAETKYHTRVAVKYVEVKE